MALLLRERLVGLLAAEVDEGDAAAPHLGGREGAGNTGEEGKIFNLTPD